ncbi:hypothetical protein A0J48_021845 [Sphaerospermopsis aphanizomenoides BCCUSP55]|uniref:hypothetical protein n=1 Tax=Sphaerospermopsis aphanizomenoides TaxID=459663 RepID=UPI00190377BB|nr:hypothetical protein [Sphaerospermopsis aphanizomenoides]MBK1990135.1 hypothetical protein [Sphaerospermopsis aphanizomenoides BCCUSP55]
MKSKDIAIEKKKYLTYGGIEQRWLLIESTERKKSDFKKLTQKISKEFLKTNKQLVKLEKEEFEQKSLAELKIKDLAAKLKYHQTSDIEISEKLKKGKTVVYQVKCKLIENQELITKHRFQCIHLVTLNQEEHISNWNTERDFILRLLPDDCLRYYQLVT